MVTSRHIHWSRLTLTLVVACAGAFGAAAIGKAIHDNAAASLHGYGARSATIEALMKDPQARAKIRADFALLRRRAQREFSARMPKPFLPEEQRRAWIAAWRRMRACAVEHDFQGVSDVAPSYGDGQTAMPNVDLDQPNAPAALGACPFQGPAVAYPSPPSVINAP